MGKDYVFELALVGVSPRVTEEEVKQIVEKALEKALGATVAARLLEVQG